MNSITKPMLAGKCERLDALSFPVLATPKLDGIRCLKIDGRALTRSFKPVSNRSTREWIEANLPDGLDGELIVQRHHVQRNRRPHRAASPASRTSPSPCSIT